MAKRSLASLNAGDLSGKRVLVRVDFNVPLDDTGAITDDTRIRAALPTINDLIGKEAKVILSAHFGRPKGEVKESMRLTPVAARLSELLNKPVTKTDSCIGPDAEAKVAAMANGDVVLLENVRFFAEEEKNEAGFAEKLAGLADVYVNDAFGAAHRAHASTEGLGHHMPAYAGRTMQAELEALESGLGNPKHPVVAIVGGAKVSTKIDLLENLIDKVDALVIGGGMANTFVAAKGIDVGKSLCEHDLADTARTIMAKAEKTGCAIVLPVDGVVAGEFKANAENETVAIDAIPADKMMLDVGPQSVMTINEWIEKAATLVWNGPLGAFEIEPFDEATVAAARAAGERAKAGKLVAVAGGGDTVAALNHAGVADDFTFVSTAGGAFLEWMEGKALPGVEALKG